MVKSKLADLAYIAKQVSGWNKLLSLGLQVYIPDILKVQYRLVIKGIPHPSSSYRTTAQLPDLRLLVGKQPQNSR